MEGNHLACNQFWWSYNKDVRYPLRGWQGCNRSHVSQVPVLGFLNLKQPVSASFTDLPRAHSDMESLAQVVSQLLSQLFGARGEDIYLLCHSGFVNVGIDRLGAEDDRIIAAAEKLQHGLLNGSKGKCLTHRELPKCQRAIPEHDRSPLWFLTPASLFYSGRWLRQSRPLCTSIEFRRLESSYEETGKTCGSSPTI